MIEMNSEDKMAIVLQEIIQDKIFLDSSDEVRFVEPAGGEIDLADLDS